MPLPFPTSERRLLYRRAIDVQIYARDDGLYEVEAGLTDVKTRDLPLASGLRVAGDPIHAMQLVLTVDADLQIHAARSTTSWSPYAGVCDQHGDAYARLVGLNLMKGFRLGVKERLAGVKGCTHLTELCQILPTAVIQAFAGLVLDAREGSADGQPPFQLDRCHALRRDGDVVRNHYPRWYRSADAAARPAAVVAMPASSS